MITIEQTKDIKYAVISASSSGTNTLVSGTAGKRIVVLAYTLIANGTVNVKFQSDSTDLSGLLYLIANVGASPAQGIYGQLATLKGGDLNLNLSGNVAVGGHLTYLLID